MLHPRSTGIVVLVAGFCALVALAAAQSDPSKPIRLVVGCEPGGGADAG